MCERVCMCVSVCVCVTDNTPVTLKLSQHSDNVLQRHAFITLILRFSVKFLKNLSKRYAIKM